MKTTNSQIQEAQQIPRRINVKACRNQIADNQ